MASGGSSGGRRDRAGSAALKRDDPEESESIRRNIDLALDWLSLNEYVLRA